MTIGYKKQRALNILQKIKNNNYKIAVFIGKYNKNICELFKDFSLDEWSSTDKQNLIANKEKKLELCLLRPYGKWFDYCFGNIQANIYSFCGIFSIDKRDIIQHPIERYKNLLQQLSNSSNPEVGHYIERSWSAIFHPITYTKVYVQLKVEQKENKIKLAYNSL